ncbi:MAG: hypothetical protein CBE43_01875 [Rhodopirellula sp. TMED283]|nr:MAG: hypothetical protein CBE43_01875 [Rhodopirellula sp. TMED283]
MCLENLELSVRCRLDWFGYGRFGKREPDDMCGNSNVIFFERCLLFHAALDGRPAQKSKWKVL